MNYIFYILTDCSLQHTKKKDYKILGLPLSSDSARLAKSYEESGIVRARDLGLMFCFINNEIFVKNLHVEIRQVTLEQPHSMGHCRRDHRGIGDFALGQCLSSQF
jgi:hypothetical protein